MNSIAAVFFLYTHVNEYSRRMYLLLYSFLKSSEVWLYSIVVMTFDDYFDDFVNLSKNEKRRKPYK